MADEQSGTVFPEAPPERIELSAERALVRCSVDRAAAAATAINESREHLRPWMGWAQEPATVASLGLFFATAEELWDQRRDFGFSIIEGPDERVVGGGGLHGRSDEHRLDIGYWVHVDRIGQGLATELSRALTDAAFAIPGVERVQIECEDTNVRSARVPEKLGFTFIGAYVPDGGVCAGRATRGWAMERGDWIAKRTAGAS